MSCKNEEIVELFYEVDRLSRRFSQYRDGNPGTYNGQYRCLFLLENVGTISQKKLTDLLQIRSTSLSELLAKLEKKGFVQRTVSDQDKRTRFVSLTETGKKEVAGYHKSRAKIHEEMVAPLSEEEKKQFYDILFKIKNYYAAEEEKK